MISPSVIAKAAAYRERFQTAQPFKHVCIEDFFTDGTAEALLRDYSEHIVERRLRSPALIARVQEAGLLNPAASAPT